ncbi:hypothetical protein [Nitratireductor sp.]|nr:hypothetical protein [Nitratireductor sp.]
MTDQVKNDAATKANTPVAGKQSMTAAKAKKLGLDPAPYGKPAKK